MKHLKHFTQKMRHSRECNESNDSQRIKNMKDDIKDVFQELIDEYDIYFIDENHYVSRDDKNFYYKLFEIDRATGRKISKRVSIKFIAPNKINYDDQMRLTRSPENEIIHKSIVLSNRLSSMGYEVRSNIWEYGISFYITDFD